MISLTFILFACSFILRPNWVLGPEFQLGSVFVFVGSTPVFIDAVSHQGSVPLFLDTGSYLDSVPCILNPCPTMVLFIY
jgi:hypothetical protein